MLPGIDDGAPDLDTALQMARVAVADGIEVTACTPHITPGVYDNDGPGIAAAIEAFRTELDRAGIPLGLVIGADVHLAPGLGIGLRSGRVPSLAGSRYFLFEPPHHVAPPMMEQVAAELLGQGYVPVLTHPERLSWIEDHYPTIVRMADAGAWMQLTAGSVVGRFGKRPRYWAERMLDEGLVHLLATDAHNLRNRSPLLSEGRDAVAERLGEPEAIAMVRTRPQGILDDRPPAQLAPKGPVGKKARPARLIRRLFQVS